MMMQLLPGCSAGSAKPEAALWGTWVFEDDQNGNAFFANRLTFYDDGCLVINGNENDAAEYVVIAPGRIKITHGGEAEVFNYEVIEDDLILSLDGNVQQFSKAGDLVIIAQSTVDLPVLESITDTSTDTSTSLPATHTQDQLPRTNTSIPPAATTTPTATLPLPNLTPTVPIDDIVVDYQVNPKDSMPMVFVPAGEFTMGNNGENADKNESPEHQVYLDAFWIYQHEVTNRQFGEYIQQTGLMTSAEIQGWSWVFGNGSKKVDGAFWSAPEGYDTNVNNRQDHPVVHISYSDAVNYCKWAGGRLPTEAEWEKAARGTDSRTFPWGESPVTGSEANFCDVQCSMEWSNKSYDDNYATTAPAGTYPEGGSVYGVMDMAGNVWEWVADYYERRYYEDSPLDNPLGPDSGENYVIRGGSWVSEPQYLTCTTRYLSDPDETSNDHGFRCVFDQLPSD